MEDYTDTASVGRFHELVAELGGMVADPVAAKPLLHELDDLCATLQNEAEDQALAGETPSRSTIDLSHEEWLETLDPVERNVVLEDWADLDESERRQLRRRYEYGQSLSSLEEIAEPGVPLCFEVIGEDTIVLAREVLAIKLHLGLDRVPAVAQKPCDCWYFNKGAEPHNALLGFETMDPVVAATIVAAIIAEDDAGLCGPELFSDPEGFEMFVSQHNWRSPVAMSVLAAYLTDAARQAEKGRLSKVRA